ncbi:MAG: M48 family metalloprotease [Candidatus Dependentiae bacterium]|nr:M48 family metalloprotease [Candidatus Dependentiae bacterium]
MINMIKQQIIGIAPLSICAISFFYFFPAMLDHFYGPIIVALFLGWSIWRIHFNNHKTFQKALLYAPTDTHKEKFEALIRSCNIDPSIINLRYAYTAEQTAMTVSNMIIIDPVMCSLCDEDSNSQIVKDVFTQHIEPKITLTQKTRLSEYKKFLTPQAQCFIFKHELGHVMDNYSAKKLGTVFLSVVITTYASIIAAKSLLIGYPVSIAIVAGMLVFALLDNMLPFLSNVLFKMPAEKRADYFAVKYSSADDIRAAADFFKKHQEIINENPERGNFLTKLPSVLTSGHPDGKTRWAYLLKLADQKKAA